MQVRFQSTCEAKLSPVEDPLDNVSSLFAQHFWQGLAWLQWLLTPGWGVLLACCPHLSCSVLSGWHGSNALLVAYHRQGSQGALGGRVPHQLEEGSKPATRREAHSSGLRVTSPGQLPAPGRLRRFALHPRSLC